MSKKEEIQKAMKAGYEDAIPPTPGDNVENIETATTAAPKADAAPIAEKVEAKVEEVKSVKFAEGLFKPYRLGSSIEQGPSGNVISNFKKPAMDYVESAKNRNNLVLTDADLKNLSNKK